MKRERKTLGIKCGDTKCESNLHCFRPSKRPASPHPEGTCKCCGVNVVDWDRVRKREIEDVTYTLEVLNHEYIRHEFWNLQINDVARANAVKKGANLLREQVYNRIKRYVGPAKIFRDGIQTSMDPDSRSAIPFGQHATATCCRKCVQYWHGIPAGREMTTQELEYCTSLVMIYLQRRIPEMGENGE